jgi:hypothetical protein
MPGRHAQQPPKPNRVRAGLLAAGAALLLLVGGWLLWGATSTKPAPATTVANQVDTPPAGPEAAPAALVSCTRSLDGAAAVITAADASRDHWGSHVRAQTDYDAGLISEQQMLDTFAATKAAGPADLASFDTARAAYAPESSGCTGLDAASLPARWQPMATQCAQRAAAVTSVVQAGEAVVGDWRAHVQMMQNKPHTDPNVYGTMWREMVNAAPPHLTAFTTARDELAQQPACQLTAG